ncbi:MAG: DHA2 family efflux MFS transporter permease subunit [Nocardioidaceae bacterium]
MLAPAPTTTHRWRAFAVLAVAYFMTIVDLTIVNVSLPTIGQHLHFSESGLQWVITAYGITFGGLMLFGGRAADLLGRRRTFMAGLGLFTVASLACALATSDSFLIVMRGAQGAGASILLPSALSIVMSMFAEGTERNKALGIWGGLGAGGATFGLIAGGVLTRYAGWEFIFFLNVPIGAAAFLLAPRVVPESRAARADGESARMRFDPFGALSVTAGLLLLVYGISTAPADGWSSAKTAATLIGSAALLVAFVVIEARVDAPLLPLRMFRSRYITGANLGGFLLGGSFFTFVFVGTLYMQQVLHYSALQTGFAWTATSVTSIALAGVSQWLVGKVGPGPILALGMAAIGGGIAWATAAGVHGHYWGNLSGPLFIVGAGTAFAFIPTSIAALTGVRDSDAGLASGLLNTSQQIGGALAVAIVSAVATSHTATLLARGHGLPSSLTGGLHWAFWVCAGIAAVGVLVGALVLPRRTAAAPPAPAAELRAIHEGALS